MPENQFFLLYRWWRDKSVGSEDQCYFIITRQEWINDYQSKTGVIDGDQTWCAEQILQGYPTFDEALEALDDQSRLDAWEEEHDD